MIHSRTNFQLSCLFRGQKVKSKRIACKFEICKAFAKPSNKSPEVKQDLYLALEKIKKYKIITVYEKTFTKLHPFHHLATKSHGLSKLAITYFLL